MFYIRANGGWFRGVAGVVHLAHTDATGYPSYIEAERCLVDLLDVIWSPPDATADYGVITDHGWVDKSSRITYLESLAWRSNQQYEAEEMARAQGGRVWQWKKSNYHHGALGPALGVVCAKCNGKNEFGAPNRGDGSYVCFECR